MVISGKIAKEWTVGMAGAALVQTYVLEQMTTETPEIPRFFGRWLRVPVPLPFSIDKLKNYLAKGLQGYVLYGRPNISSHNCLIMTLVRSGNNDLFLHIKITPIINVEGY